MNNYTLCLRELSAIEKKMHTYKTKLKLTMIYIPLSEYKD